MRTIMPPEHFSVDGRLRKNVELWVRIYTEYTTRQGLIHDAKYVDHVYEVLELDEGEGADSRKIRSSKTRWKNLLLSVHRKQKNPDQLGALTSDEKKVYDLFSDINEPNKFLNAAHRKRLRFQLGQKDRFLDGLKQSGQYLPMMEEIFRREGLPVELTRLPFVESSFNVKARSKVGASGIWQFMRSTGRLFLRVDDAVDERNDPIRATEAAARLLKGNFDSLGKWPLAVTAYNHGRKGMMKAVRVVGSEELEDVVGNYRGRTFGFASGNFFTELLAAIEAERNAEKYFGKVERARAVPAFEVSIPDYIQIRELARRTGWQIEKLRAFNSALTEAVYAGEQLIPAGYRLRLPLTAGETVDGARQAFLSRYSEIPAALKRQGQPGRKYAKKPSKRQF